MQSMHTLKLHSCELSSSGLRQDLQVERCQFLVHQTVSGEDPSVRHLICSGQFYSVGLSFLLQESPACLPPSLICLYSFFFQDSLQVCQEVRGGSEWSLCSCSGGAGQWLRLGHSGSQPRGHPHPSGSPGTEERPAWEGQRSAGLSLTEQSVIQKILKFNQLLSCAL